MMIFNYHNLNRVTGWLICHVLLWSLPCTAQYEAEAFKGLRLNEIQFIGSHNSYKPGIEPALYNILHGMDAERAAALQYGHISLTAQLDLGLRNLELDVVHDPTGGRYTSPIGLQWLQQAGSVAEPYDLAGDLQKPGLKVLHMPDIDFRSHQLLFTDCLKELRYWSKANAGHLPVIITINAKDAAEKGLNPLLPFTHDALDSIDLELRGVFSENELITPDLIRGSFESLAQAVLQQGWPLLDSLVGRFLFILDETGQKRNNYKKDHPAMKGRAMFVNDPDGSADAAIMIINEPVRDEALIQSMVRKGYLVRTRADANTVEARKNDYGRFEAAMTSGAQIITTDYYQPSQFFPSTFKVIFKDGKFTRINPVSGLKN